jgi:hypothetical protein
MIGDCANHHVGTEDATTYSLIRPRPLAARIILSFAVFLS